METTYTTLLDFHSKNPDCHVYSLLDRTIFLLKQVGYVEAQDIILDLQTLLGEIESKRIIDLICRNEQINHEQLLQKAKEAAPNIIVTEKLLFHLVLLQDCCQSTTQLASILEITLDEAIQLLKLLNLTFTIDSPLVWLENFQKHAVKERKYCEDCKAKLMGGREVITQAEDTAEERRVENRKRSLNKVMKPY